VVEHKDVTELIETIARLHDENTELREELRILRFQLGEADEGAANVAAVSNERVRLLRNTRNELHGVQHAVSELGNIIANLRNLRS
jgi:regulator of replication initiation timing